MNPSHPRTPAPPVYRASQTSAKMRSSAPPVYRPQAPPRSLQPKLSVAAQLGVRTDVLKPATAPAVYRPNQKPHILQPRFTAINRGTTIQRSSEKKSGFSQCDAKVVGATQTGEGAYSASYNIHGEIAALEDYLENGGTIGDVVKITISSAPCKYCHIILSDLGIRDKVAGFPSGGGYGNCQGGSYGWFYSEGKVSKAVQAASSKTEKEYTKWVSERVKKL